MSVLLETSLGDLVVDLEVDQCPRTCENFLKLCKTYRYNYLTFFSVQKDFLAQSGDPTNTGNGGSSIWSQLDPSSSQHTKNSFFTPERHRTLKHTTKGTLSMACTAVGDEEEDEVIAGSQFFITLADDIDYLDGKHAPFGRVVEGEEDGGTLERINDAFVDKEKRPLRDIRIQHLVVLDDPFDDPEGLVVPSRTPSPTPQQLAAIGLDASVHTVEEERPAEEVEEDKRKADTTAAALTLEMVGDLPFAEVRPPENILFVCKLNPVTRSEDLDLIFSRFGKILSCEVIKDKKTGDSLQYAFIEFDKQEAAEQAYFKMQNVLIDDRRIWVDFSQSVSKLSSSWNTSRSGGKPVKVTRGGDGSRGTSRAERGLVFDFDESSSRRSTEQYGRREERDASSRRRDDRYRDDRYPSQQRDRDGQRYQDERSHRRS
jgi:peptidyl-prolyl cis-trans isomerase-like 4